MSKIWQKEVLLHDHGDGSKTVLPILKKLYRMSDCYLPFGYCADDELGDKVKAWFANMDIDIVEKFSLVTGVLQPKFTPQLGHCTVNNTPALSATSRAVL